MKGRCFTMFIILFLTTSQSFLISPVEGGSDFKAGVRVSSGCKASEDPRTFYFHNYNNLTDMAFLLRPDWPKNGSFFVFGGSYTDGLTSATYTVQPLKCMIESEYKGETAWGGVISWPTQPLEQDVRVKGVVDFYIWVNGAVGHGFHAHFYQGAGVVAFLTEVGVDPVTHERGILWMSKMASIGGRGWDMPESLSELHLKVEVNHIFREGSAISCTFGIAHTEKGRMANVYFDASPTPSRMILPWEEEWPRPPPASEGGPLIALITSSYFRYACEDDLIYLGYSHDTYTEGNITILFEEGKLSSYTALYIATHAIGTGKIMQYLEENKDQILTFLSNGGGLVVMAEARYDWLPDQISLPSWHGEQLHKEPYMCLNMIGDYYSCPLTLYPNNLTTRTYPATVVYAHDNPHLCDYYLAAWQTQPPGTFIENYRSIARSKHYPPNYMIPNPLLTTWISGIYNQRGRISITTMKLDLLSGGRDEYGYAAGKPFYDGREAIDNTLWWVCNLPYP